MQISAAIQTMYCFMLTYFPQVIFVCSSDDLLANDKPIVKNAPFVFAYSRIALSIYR